MTDTSILKAVWFGFPPVPRSSRASESATQFAASGNTHNLKINMDTELNNETSASLGFRAVVPFVHFCAGLIVQHISRKTAKIKLIKNESLRHFFLAESLDIAIVPVSGNFVPMTM